MKNTTYAQLAKVLIEAMTARDINSRLPKYEETQLISVPTDMLDRWIDVINLAMHEDDTKEERASA